MIVGVCGFSWSGSSAMADYLKEYEGLDIYDKMEFILAFHPDGISDLDYNLNVNCSKFLSSGVAIPRFKKLAKLLLNKATNGAIVKLTDDYIDKITQVKWKGANGSREVLVGPSWFYKNIIERIINRGLFSKLPEKTVKRYNIYPIKEQFFSVQPDSFISITQDYIDKILMVLGVDTSKIVVLDQPFAGNIPSNTMKFFRDAKAIIIDRDPRDLYLLAKEYYPTKTYQTPHDSVESFIDFYRNMHKTLEVEIIKSDILYLHFEELVYKYEETEEKVRDFLGLNVENHVAAKQFFNPTLSAANTRLFEKCTKYENDIRLIESSLSNYLFDFSNYKLDNSGRMFDRIQELNDKTK